VYEKKDVDSMLVSKLDFGRDEKGDHVFYKLLFHGNLIRTKLSHGSNRDVNDWLQAQICKQLNVDKKFFLGMMDCYIAKEDYYNELKQVFDGVIHTAQGAKYDERKKSKRSKRKRDKRK
jgi:hypothetical protein